MNYIKEIDTSLFLFLNGKHNEIFDFIMGWVSYKFTWIPAYALLLYFTWKKTGNKLFIVIISVVLLILISDQASVHLFKNIFERYRPCHNLIIKEKLHLVGDCGGLYGFVSSHAANTFALAAFFSFFFKNKRFTFLIFFWASLCSYSRIYLGVHYPLDIISGALLGIFSGYLVVSFYTLAAKKIA